MYTPNVVMDALNRRGFQEAEQLLNNGEKLPPTIEAFTLKQALLDLKELLDAGILTQDEFDVEKKKLLA
jgi:hypothetical protein